MWRDLVKDRDNYTCQVCGKYGKSNQAHHIVGRSNHAIRWDMRNGVTLCVGCHMRAHNDPLGFTKWLMDYREDDYEYLLKKKNETWDKRYDKVIEYLEGVR